MNRSAYSPISQPAPELFFSGKTACCFTGHRPTGLPSDIAGMAVLRARLMETIFVAANAGVTLFLAGGAQGFDMIAAEAVLYLRNTQDLPLTLQLELPSPRQPEGWPPADRDRYETILDAADAIHYAGETNDASCMLRRNRRLVDQADCCLCYLKTMRGGTLYTVNYALDHNIPVYNLALLRG
jgi:uncharacterized phage-like protein YoqJ